MSLYSIQPQARRGKSLFRGAPERCQPVYQNAVYAERYSCLRYGGEEAKSNETILPARRGEMVQQQTAHDAGNGNAVTAKREAESAVGAAAYAVE
jgi:hypothetical protein